LRQKRAQDRILRLGEHGLPRIGTSDHVVFANDQFAVKLVEESTSTTPRLTPPPPSSPSIHDAPHMPAGTAALSSFYFCGNLQ
jgi:hypothetical protein